MTSAMNEPGWSPDSLNIHYDGPLRPCPFCGCDRVRLYEHNYAQAFRYSCAECGAHGPQRASTAEAAAGWNRRSR